MNSKLHYFFWKLLYSQKLKKYKNIHKGKSCFLIDNGPSINNMDLTVLKDYYTFGLNKIFLIEDRGIDLNLSYLVSVNELVIEQSIERFLNMKCPVFLPYQKIPNPKLNSGNLEYLYTGRGAYFQKNISSKIEEGFTVTYVAMQLAFYMGFEKVVLIGVDHNFVASGKPNEKQEFKGNDMNHFDPNYFKNMQWNLPDLESSELFYRIAKYNYVNNGREILDATLNGKLEVFDKITYEDALKFVSKK